MMLPFVAVALKVCDSLEIADQAGQKIVMRFAKIYDPQKMGDIVLKAKSYYWWQKNPKAAFMKAVGEVNRQEKSLTGESKPVITKS